MVTIVKTEARHQEEFLMSEANGDRSREAATLSSGQKVVDGQVMKWSGLEIVAAAGSFDSDDASDEDIAGIVSGNWDASVTGTNADIPGVPYIARDAVVRHSSLTYHTGTADADKQAAVTVALAAKGIIVRPTP